MKKLTIALGGAVLVAMLIIPPSIGLAAIGGFMEDFSSAVLDPTWTVIPGARYYYLFFGLPVNDYSLTANPGHLRYTINPMSHQWGFLNGYTAAPHRN